MDHIKGEQLSRKDTPFFWWFMAKSTMTIPHLVKKGLDNLNIITLIFILFVQRWNKTVRGWFRHEGN